ncbi:MAG: outer membrane protein assembly factor BamA [Desulfobacteraceae bacterium]|nr:outer membrane protein assembly factor BamA [Desulfobacteraceae bacterium]
MNKISIYSRTCSLKALLIWSIIILFGFVKPGFAANPEKHPKETIFQIDVKILGIKGDTTFWNSIARDLISLKPLDPYNNDLIKQAIVGLSDSNLFQSIHVSDPVKTTRGLKITFELIPYGRIKDIKIYKAFPLFDREVLDIMTLYNGELFSKKSLEQQSSRVITLFKKQGFIDPKVTLSAQKDGYDGNYLISVHINKGDFFRVNKVEIQGNKSFLSSRLKLRTETWKASVLLGSAKRFIQNNLDDDVKELIAFYRTQKFADVAITPEVIRDRKKKQVDVIFHVEEGPKYLIDFKGNKKFWDYTLNKEMTLEKDGNKNNFALGKSIRNLKEKYTMKGYPDVKIKSGIKENTLSRPPEKQVTISINEGDKYCVSKIDILGNRSITQKQIFKNILTQTSTLSNCNIYVANQLDKDINTLRELYFTKGFIGIKIDKHIRFLDADNQDKTKVKHVQIELVIDEGIRTRVEKVQFKGLSALSRDRALEFITLKSGIPFDPHMMEKDEKNLGQKISELGYPNSWVTGVVKFSPDRSGAILTYTVEQGHYVRVGHIYYQGNFRTKQSILDNKMQIFSGEPFSLVKLLESRQNLMEIAALSSVRFTTIGLNNNASKVDIIIVVEEKKPYFVETGTGYDTQRRFYLDSTVGDHNFLGRNLDLQLKGEYSQIGYNWNIALTEPQLFYTKILSSTRFFGGKQEEFNKDYGIKTRGIAQNFSRTFLSNKLIVNLGLMHESRDQYPTQYRQDTETTQYDSRNIITISPGISYRTIDSYIKPSKGHISTFNMELLKGLDNDLDDFIKYRLETRYYHTVFKPLVLALRGQYQLIQPYGSNRVVPEDQLFFLGGSSSVRGFDENLLQYDSTGNAVGGRETILGSIEARYDLGLNFELSTFYDIGAVKKTQGKDADHTFRDSIGLGLSYMTPIGPIGLLYGWKLDPRANESAGRFSFSMGYTF